MMLLAVLRLFLPALLLIRSQQLIVLFSHVSERKEKNHQSDHKDKHDPRYDHGDPPAVDLLLLGRRTLGILIVPWLAGRMCLPLGLHPLRPRLSGRRRLYCPSALGAEFRPLRQRRSANLTVHFFPPNSRSS